MKLIKQLDQKGCGLACISILTGLAYQKVQCIAVEYGQHNNGLSITSNHLIEIAKKTGLLSISSKRRKTFTCISDLPDKAILSIGYKETTKQWHWVVFERKDENVFIYDPEIPKKYASEIEIKQLNITHYLSIKV